MFKKFLITFFVIFTFTFYAVYERSQISALPVIAPQTRQINPASETVLTLSPPTTASPATVPVVSVPTPAPIVSTPPASAQVQLSQPIVKPKQIPVPKPVSVPTPAPVVITPRPAPKPQGMYADGTYTGDSADAYYGNVQVQATVQGGKITDVQFLDYPQDRRNSQRINSYAMPQLTQEAIQAQSANVNTISGATDTSLAFRESLGVALTQAKN